MHRDRAIPVLLLISAPSGGGKTTVCERLVSGAAGLTRAVTCTTRLPRTGERAGYDYHFLTAADFDRRVAAGEFLEHATVYGNRYGTLKSEVIDRLRAGEDVLLNIDVQGAAAVRTAARADAELARSLVTIFLTPPSIAVLEQRLHRRGKDSPETIQRRLAEARRELGEAKHFDYLVLSGTIEEDERRVRAIHAAEKMRLARVTLPEL